MQALPKVSPDLLAAVRPDERMLARLTDMAGTLAANLAVAALILIITFWASGWAASLTKRALGGLHRRNPDPTLQSFVGSLVRYLVVIVGLVAVLQQLGVKTTSVLAVLGAASLAVGLALQGALSNVAAGVMILVFRPYRVGDTIDTGGKQGSVKSLDLFVTELATADNVRLIIPNSKVFGDVITNYSYYPRRRVDAAFKVPLDRDLPATLAALKARLATDPKARKEPAPSVEVTGLSEVFAEAVVHAWCAREDAPALKSDLLLAARLLSVDAKAALPPPTPATPKAQREIGAQRRFRFRFGRKRR